MPFKLNFLGDKAYTDRINELLFLWENNGSFVFTTSGTSGKPKTFSFTRKEIELAIDGTVNALGLQKHHEHILLCLDPKYIAGAMMVLRALHLECTLTVCKASANIWKQIPDDHAFTFASFVPPQIADDGFDSRKFANIKTILIGGMSLALHLKERVLSQGNEVYMSYGMTETLSHIALMSLNRSNHYELLPGNRLMLSEAGTLIIETPYLPEKVITNDLAEIFEDGSFKVLGRSDFIINTGGFKVSPEKVEAAIQAYAHDLIGNFGNVMVLGTLDEKLGEKVWLLSERRIDDLTFENILFRLFGKLEKHEIPKGTSDYGLFEYTENGKVARRQIINNFKIRLFG